MKGNGALLIIRANEKKINDKKEQVHNKCSMQFLGVYFLIAFFVFLECVLEC
jgi:hypothetical protein